MHQNVSLYKENKSNTVFLDLKTCIHVIKMKLPASENRISAVMQNRSLIFQDKIISNNLIKVPAIEFM